MSTKLCPPFRLGGDILLAMPYIESSRFTDLVRTVDVKEVRLYMKNLLVALRHIHSFGIIHRDIKPANFLYDPLRKKFGLIDFGLAQKGPVVPISPVKVRLYFIKINDINSSR